MVVTFSSFRATVEYHRRAEGELPSVSVTIAVNEDELILRYACLTEMNLFSTVSCVLLFSIRDRGGGMPRAILEKIFDYHFSSNNLLSDPSMLSYTDFENHLYDQLVTRDNKNRMSG